MAIKTEVKIPEVNDNGQVVSNGIADGAITSDKLASGVGGGLEIIEITKQTNEYYETFPFVNSTYLCFQCTPYNNDKENYTLKLFYTSFDAGNFTAVKLVQAELKRPSYNYYSLIGRVINQAGSWRSTASSENMPQSIAVASLLDTTQTTEFPLFSKASDDYGSGNMRFSNFSSGRYLYIPKSTSAQAALVALQPVQAEVEALETEVATLNDAVSTQSMENDVQIDESKLNELETKTKELEEKQETLEKMRQDYFSKLEDWKNES